MPCRLRDAFEGDFEDQLGMDTAYETKSLAGILLDELGHFLEFLVGKATVGFGEGHQGIAIFHGKGEVGVQIGAAAMASLGIDHHRIDGQGINLPFPPVSFFRPDW
jgi:hypothetical protein